VTQNLSYAKGVEISVCVNKMMGLEEMRIFTDLSEL